MLKEDCKDCVCLVEGDNGKWVCDEVDRNIKDINECPEKALKIKKRVRIIVDIRCNEDFDIQDLAVGKGFDDSTLIEDREDSFMILPKDDDFKITKYINTEEVDN